MLRGNLERSNECVLEKNREIKTLALLNKEVLITEGPRGAASGIKAVLLQGVSQVEREGHQV